MGDTIDVGIDLGTTNSAIAVSTGHDLSIIKNSIDQSDITPSAVYMPKPGVVHVGRRASARRRADPDNAFGEFKRDMGLANATRRFATAGLTMSPEQLSAEVLKSLRRDAAARLGEPPHAAVITVPAAFKLHQTNATVEAAKLAGFDLPCPLVQEPTAAAFAYGFQDRAEQSYWMVFDFGGGTFDAAVVSIRDGELRVLDHAGDPHLGGKDIDWAVVDRILAPAAAKEFDLTEFSRDNAAWRGNFALLKDAAEQAKIELSTMDSVELSLDLLVGRGQTVFFEASLSRAQLAGVAEPFYRRAISLCRDALGSANLDRSDIDRVILVGGATLAPHVRELLADPTHGLGIEVDHSADPITAVARGAAIFASTVAMDVPPPAPSVGEFTVQLEFPRSTVLSNPTVGGRFTASAPVDWQRYRVSLDNHSGQEFHSGEIALDADGTFVTDVRLEEQATSTFQLELRDEHGNKTTVRPDSLTIRHVLNDFGGETLVNSLGIAQADGTIATILPRGTTLPAKQTREFQTSATLRRSDSEALIRIPLIEGERERAEWNAQIGGIDIRPSDVRSDVPQGADVEVTISVNESRLVTAVADVPLLEVQLETDVDLSSVRPPDAATLRRWLADVEQRLPQVRGSVDKAGSPTASERMSTVESSGILGQARGHVAAAEDNPGEAAAGAELLRELQAELDKVEKELRLPALRDEFNDVADECRGLLGRFGTAEDRAELANLEERMRRAIADANEREAQQTLERLRDLGVDLLRKDDDWPEMVFEAMRSMSDKCTDRAHARELVREGERAVATRDRRALAGVNERLRRLLPVEVSDESIVMLQSGRGGR